MARIGVLCLLLLVGTGLLGAQEVQSWFSRSPDAGPYSGLRVALLSLAERARAGMHSDFPLAQRLAEGASKGVDPSRLLAALKAETEELLGLAAEIAKRGLLPVESGSAGTMMAQIGIGLRAGLVRADVLAAFDGALERASGSAAAERALTTLGTVAGLNIPPEERLAFVRALASSYLPTARLRSLRGALVDLLARRLDPVEATDALLKILGAGPASGASGGKAEGQPDSGRPAAGNKPDAGRGSPDHPSPGSGKR